MYQAACRRLLVRLSSRQRLRFVKYTTCAIFFTFQAVPLHALEQWATPIDTSNLHPLVHIYGQPAPALPQRKVAPYNRTSTAAEPLHWSIKSELANISNEGSSDREQVLLDGEIWRTELTLRVPLGRGWFSIRQPYLTVSGGELDHMIEEFHGVVGAPNGNRDKRPENAVRFFYSRDDITLLENRGGSGFGDTQLSYQTTLKEKRNYYSNASAGIKFPTGNASKLTGSDSTDLFLQYSIASSGTSHLGYYIRGGLHWTSANGLLQQQRRKLVAYTSLGLQLRYSESVAIKMQLDAHSPYYRSELKELGHSSGLLTLGASIKAGRSTQLDLYFTEDIVVDTGPDIVFGLSIRRHM